MFSIEGQRFTVRAEGKGLQFRFTLDYQFQALHNRKVREHQGLLVPVELGKSFQLKIGHFLFSFTFQRPI